MVFFLLKIRHYNSNQHLINYFKITDILKVCNNCQIEQLNILIQKKIFIENINEIDASFYFDENLKYGILSVGKSYRRG